MIKLEPTDRNIVIMLALAVFIIIVGPILVIWSLNTLFPILQIPYTLETWCATWLIPTVLKSNVSFKGK